MPREHWTGKGTDQDTAQLALECLIFGREPNESNFILDRASNCSLKFKQ